MIDRRLAALRRRVDALAPWSGAMTVWLAIIGGIVLVVAVIALDGSPGWGYDFEAYYLAAVRLARGEGIYWPWMLDASYRPGPYGLYLYAPPLAAALVPVTTWTLGATTAIWAALHIGLVMLSCALLPVTRRVRLATFAAAAFSGAILADTHLGNVSVIVTFLSVVTWRWLDKPIASGAMALALTLRPTLGLVLVWAFLRRRWSFVVTTVVVLTVIVLASLPMVGVDGYVAFVKALRNLSGMTGAPNNLDLGSTILRFGVPATVANVVLYAGFAIGLAAMLVSLRYDRDLGYVVTVGGALLVTPLLWDHYLSTLIIPAAFLAHRGRTWGLLLPVVTWLPPPLMPFVVVVATLAPFLTRRWVDQPASGETIKTSPPSLVTA
ncbi:MAG: glycosyltransferase 87 family protein [Candidatus Limnocylindrales bacterium]